jgi:hypothetical protein
MASGCGICRDLARKLATNPANGSTIESGWFRDALATALRQSGLSART